MRTLEPIWLKTPTMAEKARGYIWQVMDNAVGPLSRAAIRLNGRSDCNDASAHGRGWCTGTTLPSPYQQIFSFLQALRGLKDQPHALAMEFMILTAARSGEVRQTMWQDLDLTSGVWTSSRFRSRPRVRTRLMQNRTAFL